MFPPLLLRWSDPLTVSATTGALHPYLGHCWPQFGMPNTMLDHASLLSRDSLPNVQCVHVGRHLFHPRTARMAWRRIDDRVASRALLCCTTIQPHLIVPTHGSLALNAGGCGACSHVQAMDNCVSEVLIRQIADAVVTLGMKDLGYQYAALLRRSRMHMLRSPHTDRQLISSSQP